jgi:hypothetical protein
MVWRKMMNNAHQENGTMAGPPIFTAPAYGFVMALYLDWLTRTPTRERFLLTCDGTHKETQIRFQVPQTGHVRASCCTDPSSLPGSSADPPDSAVTASAVLQRRLAHGSLPPSWRLGPRHRRLSCRSVSSGTRFELNRNGTTKIFHSFR